MLHLQKIIEIQSRSSPCDHCRERPAPVTTNFCETRLNCHLNSVMKSSRKRPLLGLPNGTFPLFLSDYEDYER